jgi:hypothetical protein
MNIKELWTIVYDYGKFVRHEKIDGLKAWTAVKAVFEELPTTGRWTNQCLLFYDELKKLGVKGDDEDKKNVNQEIWEQYHFLLQHGSIPYLNKDLLKLSHLMQIAYNSGQYAYVSDSKNFTDDMKRYYEINNLGSIETYMDEESLKIINDTIPETFIDTIILTTKAMQLGGYYGYKYLKYKHKYRKAKKAFKN